MRSNALDESAPPVGGPTLRAGVLLASGLTVGIWLFVGYYFGGRIQDLETHAAAISARYVRAQELLTDARNQVLLSSVYVRDALLDATPAVVEANRREMDRVYALAARALQEYEPILGLPSDRDRILQLQHEIEALHVTMRDVLSTDSRDWPQHAGALLRTQIVPKREAAVRIAEELQSLNRGAFVQHQSEIAALYRIAQRRVWQSLGLALAASLMIGLLTALYAGRLERRIGLQRARDTQTQVDLQRLSAQLMRVQEEERRNIARELHDEVGQVLTALKVELTLAQNALDSAGVAPTALDDARSAADRALQSTRDLSHLLHPAVLDDLGLAAALDAYLKGFSRLQDVRIDLVRRGMEERLAPETEAAAYRIVQEAVTNVRKHARASTCRVELSRIAKALRITIDDDGCGFGPVREPLSQPTRGLGLIGIRERVAQLGGTLRLESAQGQGTRVTVDLPVPSKSEVPCTS